MISCQHKILDGDDNMQTIIIIIHLVVEIDILLFLSWWRSILGLVVAAAWAWQWWWPGQWCQWRQTMITFDWDPPWSKLLSCLPALSLSSSSLTFPPPACCCPLLLDIEPFAKPFPPPPLKLVWNLRNFSARTLPDKISNLETPWAPALRLGWVGWKERATCASELLRAWGGGSRRGDSLSPTSCL